jgi:transcriptional regulator with XRE-family HTH domain
MKINAELVLKARKSRCWSQEELAIASGLNLRTIQRIEKESSASLQSKKALASALEIDIQDLDYEEIRMKTCPECNSKEVYQYKGEVETATISGELLPKLGSTVFSSAKVRPVVCAECGNLRLYASKDAVEKMKTSRQWRQF